MYKNDEEVLHLQRWNLNEISAFGHASANMQFFELTCFE